MSDSQHILEEIVQVRDEASARLQSIGGEGEKASKKIQEGAKAANKGLADTAKGAETSKRALVEVGPAGSKALGIVGAGASAAAAGLGAATAAASGAETAIIGMGASIASAFAAGGPVGGALAITASAIGFLIGQGKKADETFKALEGSVAASLTAIRGSTDAAVESLERLRAVREALEGGRDASTADTTVQRKQALAKVEREIRDLQLEQNKAQYAFQNAVSATVKEAKSALDVQRLMSGATEEVAQAMQALSDASIPLKDRFLLAEQVLQSMGDNADDARKRMFTLGQAAEAINLKEKEAAALREGFAEIDKAKALEAAAATKERVKALEFQIRLMRETSAEGRVQLERARSLLGLTEEEKGLRQQIFDLEDRASQRDRNNTEQDRLDLLREQYNRRLETLTLSQDELRLLTEQREIDKVRAELGNAEADALAAALELVRARIKEEEAAGKIKAINDRETARFEAEKARLTAVQQATLESVTTELGRINAELAGGVDGLKAFNDELERQTLLEKGISSELIDQLQSKREQLELAREQRKEAEKEADAKTKGSDAEKRSGSKGESKFGKVFGAVFNGGLGSELFGAGSGPVRSPWASKPKNSGGGSAESAASPAMEEANKAAAVGDEIAKVGEEATAAAAAIAEELKAAQGFIKGIAKGLDSVDGLTERVTELLKGSMESISQVVADGFTRVGAAQADIRARLSTLERQVANATAGGVAGR